METLGGNPDPGRVRVATLAHALRAVDRRAQRHRLEIQRQIALTDAIHARLGRHRGARRAVARTRGLAHRGGRAVRAARRWWTAVLARGAPGDSEERTRLPVVLSRQTLVAPAAQATRASRARRRSRCHGHERAT